MKMNNFNLIMMFQLPLIWLGKSNGVKMKYSYTNYM